MGITVRKATEADFSAIQQVAQIAWEETYKNIIPVSVQEHFLEKAYSIEQLHRKLDMTAFFVGEIENKVVAFANLHQSKKENDLSAIYVHPEFQSKGLGNALLKKIMNELQRGDELVVYLEKGNHQAESFYAKYGFTFIEEFNEVILNHTFQTLKMSVVIEG
ncbi:GNAT family N-acetyltransferase [Oceanobacillus jeddahense]|uniref:GNAT family N-acetyltransferase n=1 Tax=Oceanobacillus jeddahense TaxID=1462527 RepID=UPI0005962A32|nr:GNAT family N-acetyltransferase [Oceanobacillus jeddahense]